MTFLSLVLALVLQPIPEQPKALAWNYPDLTVEQVVFQVCVDSIPCVTINPKDYRTSVPDPSAEPGESSYLYPMPALEMVTNHSATLKTCNKDLLTLCTPSSPVVAEFKIFIQPQTATDFRAK